MKERIIALGILVFSLVYLAGAIELKVGTVDQPGSGFVPAFIAGALLIVSAYNVYKSFREAATEKEGSWFKLAPIGVAASIIVYPFILNPLNFIISTFIVLAALLILLRFKSIWVSILTASVTTLVSFILFSTVLGVVLPSGFLEDMITRIL